MPGRSGLNEGGSMMQERGDGGRGIRQVVSGALRDERGATAIEYGLIAALIALVVIAGVTNVGNNLKGKFNNIANAVK